MPFAQGLRPWSVFKSNGSGNLAKVEFRTSPDVLANVRFAPEPAIPLHFAEGYRCDPIAFGGQRGRGRDARGSPFSSLLSKNLFIR
jgi:hypothetical protein